VIKNNLRLELNFKHLKNEEKNLRSRGRKSQNVKTGGGWIVQEAQAELWQMRRRASPDLKSMKPLYKKW
jgi:hypothetical protein